MVVGGELEGSPVDDNPQVTGPSGPAPGEGLDALRPEGGLGTRETKLIKITTLENRRRGMSVAFVLAEESEDATLSDGSLPARARELLLAMEGQALVHGYTRTGKPRIAIISETCSRGTHLHAGFAAVPIDMETP